ncbi:MAG: serine/threonine protein kinase [Planctomycetes bacterium]|nr:serine/threonine protein kinase [Planctomycetota bacterium]
MTDPDNFAAPDPIPDEVDKGLALAYGSASIPALSVLAQIADLTGAQPSITLREPGGAGDTPMLRPLGPDRRIEAGKYVVQGELGHGGVGAVHRAHDQDLGRDVAMKFLHERYRGDPSIVHRFVEEAQIGGQLQHPGIVPVYDLGIVDGKPFFAMKLVKGVTLAKKLGDRTSAAVDRHAFVSIFEQVCQTMAYAHARGVVHRDLKPANVMIGSFGEVQVVDWGMGKVLHQGGVADEQRSVARQADLSVIETSRSSGHGTQSVMGSVMGTPGYMPPEQARGDVEAMDERSDVFALGAILCEILTGKPPYVGDRNEMIGMAALCKLDDAQARLAACGAEPELIELVQACLMPAPAARPQSAEQVAAGIREYLAATERRGHDARIEAAEAKVRVAGLRRTAIVGSTLTVFIAIGLLASLWLWREAESQREQADHIADFMSQTLEGVGPSVALGRDTTMLVELMDAAAQRIKDGDLEGNLEAELRLCSTIGNAYRELASHDAAAEMLVRADTKARATHAGDHAAKTRALHDLARLSAATGRFAEAERFCGGALAMMRRLSGADRPDLAVCLRSLGTILLRMRNHEAAEPVLREALAMNERLYGDSHPEVAKVLLSLAGALRNLGEHEELDEAERLTRRAEAMLRTPGDHPLLAGCLSSLSSLLIIRGRAAEAEPIARDALAMVRRLWPGDHRKVAGCQDDLAYVCLLQEKFAAAQRLYVDSLAMLRRLGLERTAFTADCLSTLAFTLNASGDVAGAEARLRECLAIRESDEKQAGNWRTFYARSMLGEVLMRQQEFDEAERELLAGYRGMKAREASIPPGGRTRIPEALARLVDFYAATGNANEAAAWQVRLEAARAVPR